MGNLKHGLVLRVMMRVSWGCKGYVEVNMIMSHSLGLNGNVNIHGQSSSFAIQLFFFFKNKIGLKRLTILGFFKTWVNIATNFLTFGLGSPK
jgi:hypothetical protein